MWPAWYVLRRLLVLTGVHVDARAKGMLPSSFSLHTCMQMSFLYMMGLEGP